MTCAGCDDCLATSTEIQYEIHITVERIADLSTFNNECTDLDVKPLLVNDFFRNGDERLSMMTSSRHKGDDHSAHAEMRRVADGLARAGVKVSRKKIETVPWHPYAPTDVNGRTPNPGQYFECHFKIHTEITSGLQQILRASNLYLSANPMKYGVVMATLRYADMTIDVFNATVQIMENYLKKQRLQVDPPRVEFTIYDSNPTYDDDWIK